MGVREGTTLRYSESLLLELPFVVLGSETAVTQLRKSRPMYYK